MLSGLTEADQDAALRILQSMNRALREAPGEQPHSDRRLGISLCAAALAPRGARVCGIGGPPQSMT
jgi:hypothetical protein